MDRIASIINDNNIDIVALQEVLGEGKILTGRSLNDVSGQAKAYEYSLKCRLREIGEYVGEILKHVQETTPILEKMTDKKVMLSCGKQIPLSCPEMNTGKKYIRAYGININIKGKIVYV